MLDPNHEITKMEDLPKVTIMDDGDGDYHLQHLSQNVVMNEEDALNSLFIGDTNRMIAETPMNQASTRSHCIFSIYISSRKQGESVIRKAKLHLVDLAGSERIGKTGVVGNLATEAKYINLSLHYLEQVIVALGERSRTHIPYRNSMMTSVLRDSLGGNCKTTMIATLNTMGSNIDETVSTCRFAQRVALIKNSATLNEETDPAAMVAQLREEVARLKAELALATGGSEDTGPLGAAEILRCREMVDEYLSDETGKATLMLGDMRKIQECFRLMKERGGTGGGRPAIGNGDGPPGVPALLPADGAADEDVQRLEDTLRQRDNEISILVAKLKKERAKSKSAGGSGGRGGSESQQQMMHAASAAESAGRPAAANPPSSSSTAAAAVPSPRKATVPIIPPDRAEAFEFFRQSHPDRDSILENRRRLKELSQQAKALGGQVNESRTTINSLKGQIQKARLQNGVAGLVEGGAAPIDMSLEETSLRRALESAKMEYKSKIGGLKSFKKEIEHLQHLLEMAKVKLHRDFEAWSQDAGQMAAMMPPSASAAVPAAPPTSYSQGGGNPAVDGQRVQKAWGTPPLSPIGKSAVGVPAAAPAYPAQPPMQPMHAGAQHQLYSVAPPAAAAAEPVDDDISAFFAARDALRNR